jgi:DNA-directed RNA polymerase specialized sigma24 family protein
VCEAAPHDPHSISLQGRTALRYGQVGPHRHRWQAGQEHRRRPRARARWRVAQIVAMTNTYCAHCGIKLTAGKPHGKDCPHRHPVDREQLIAAEIAYQDAHKATEGLRQERNDLILLALQQGWTHAQLSEATGLSRGRIGQIKPTA